MQEQSLAYLDHNVLDLLTKGRAAIVGELLRGMSLIPVFSNENLAEIRRSVGYEQKFLEQLERMNARYLIPVLDAQFRHTGGAEVRVIRPRDAYDQYIESLSILPDSDFGLAGILQKFYGGRSDQSFGEIVSAGIGELGVLLEKLRVELSGTPGLDEKNRSAIAEIAAHLPSTLKEKLGTFTAQLDALPSTAVDQVRVTFGLGPKILNNIKPPKILGKIWELAKAKCPGVEFECFFGIKPFPFEQDAGRERTVLEKVNAIYHQLNFLGYYRDSKMHRQRRFVASFSDMTHAGLASLCRVLICGDGDLVMKAAAAYEHLDVGTQVLHLKSNHIVGRE